MQDTLDACSKENVAQMQAALDQIYRQHSQGYGHDYRKSWQLQIPTDPAGPQLNIQLDTSYRAILFAEDLTTPPAEPFEIIISPPPENN